MNSNLTIEEAAQQIALTNFDWDSATSDIQILKYKNINRSKLTQHQVNMLDLYDNKPIMDRVITKGLIVNGKIKSISKREMVVDVDYKDDIFVDHKQSEFAIISGFNVGDNVDVLIKEIQEKPYVIKGSVIDLLKMKVNNKIVESFNEGGVLTAMVTEVIPAGYMVNLELDKITIPAFMPNTLADVNKLYDANILLGKRINVMVESLQQEKGVYVVSRKKYLNTLIPEKISKLSFDKVYEGHVTGTTPFGVFVQFDGCLTGMVHKMNVNEAYREKIQEIEPGTLMVFYIKEITNKNKIILTQTSEDSLWDTAKTGQVMSGEVIAVKSFGTLVKLDYETVGLLKNTYLTRINKTLKVGEIVEVKIVNILREDRKIYLSLTESN